jgi:uncharacterized delta-60 repeat protein
VNDSNGRNFDEVLAFACCSNGSSNFFATNDLLIDRFTFVGARGVDCAPECSVIHAAHTFTHSHTHALTRSRTIFAIVLPLRSRRQPMSLPIIHMLIRMAVTLVALACMSTGAQSFGALDPSFGSGGTVTTAVGTGTSHDVPRGIAVQPDGKIVVAGTCASLFCMVRYEVNGLLDTTFGSGGRVLKTLFGGDPTFGGDRAYAMALQPDGKIVLAGQCASGLSQLFCVARFTPAGEFDSNFGAGVGWVSIGFASTSEGARAVATQSDGKIVVAGQCNSLGTTALDFCFARLLPSGDLDTAFNALGTPGKVIAPSGAGDTRNQYATALTLQPDGKIVVAGYCNLGALDFICLLRYQGDGSQVDVGFGSQGWASYSVGFEGTTARAYSVALQPNGKIVVGAECDGRLCGARFLGNGSLDAEFADNGLLIPQTGSVTEQMVGFVALRTDGDIVLAGWDNPVSGICHAYLFLAQSTGVRVGSVTSTYCIGYVGVALQSDGKILTILASSSGNADFVVERRDGGEMAYRQCSLDIDGDGKVNATTDALIHARIAFGMTGAAVINGITFAAHAARKTWPDIRTYLVTQCGMAIP